MTAPKTAYIIAIRHSVSDAAEMAAYGKAAAAARQPGMTALAAYGRCETLEGHPSDGVVLLQFPDWDAARAWYDSPAYQKARDHRLKGGEYSFLLFEGV